MSKPLFSLLDFWASDETYANYRIPGMIVTNQGTLIAYCEARKHDKCENNDWAMMDILFQRSEDQGETFSAPMLLAQGNETHHTVNNPVMVQDKNGRIHFLYCEDYSIRGGRVLRRYSDDDGLTWSDPIDITESTMPNYRNVFALGPGHGIVTRENTIIIPVWMVPKHFCSYTEAHHPSVVSILYSQDNGETWALGDIIETRRDIINPNETEVALTSDGRIYLNSRHMAHYRVKGYSKTGYSDWTELEPEYQLTCPQCFASVVAYHDEAHPYTLIYAGCANQIKRTNVTVFASTDDGKTFSTSRLLDSNRGGYTELAVDHKAGLIYVLYEEDFGAAVHLAKFNYEWLLERNDGK